MGTEINNQGFDSLEKSTDLPAQARVAEIETMEIQNNPSENGKNVTEKKSKKIYTKTDGIAAVGSFIMGFLYFRLLITSAGNFQVYFPVFTIVYLLLIFLYGKSKNAKFPRESFIWAVVCILSAVIFKIDGFYRFAICTLSAAYFTRCRGGALIDSGTGGYIPVDILNVYVTMPFGNFFSVYPAFAGLFKKNRRNGKKRKMPLRAIRGIVLAVAAISIIMPLLLSADRNMAGTLEKWTNGFFHMLFPEKISFGEILFNLIPSLLVAQYIFGLTFSSFSAEKYGAVSRRTAVKTRNSVKIAPAITMQIVLWAVCAVYLVFIAFQANYLFGAFAGKLYGNMTYSEYARIGFFQLCQVCRINLGILALCNLFTKDEDKRKTLPRKIVLCLLSILLLATAGAKMGMYIRAYGLTSKRIFSSAFLIWLAITMLFTLAREKIDFNLVKYCVFAGVIIFSVLFSCDIYTLSDKFNTAYGYDEKPEFSEFLYTAEYDYESGTNVIVFEDVKFLPYSPGDRDFLGDYLGLCYVPANEDEEVHSDAVYSFINYSPDEIIIDHDYVTGDYTVYRREGSDLVPEMPNWDAF